MKRPPYIECPACGSAAVVRSSLRDRCSRCGHAARRFEAVALDPTLFDTRPRAWAGGWGATRVLPIRYREGE